MKIIYKEKRTFDEIRVYALKQSVKEHYQLLLSRKDNDKSERILAIYSISIDKGIVYNFTNIDLCYNYIANYDFYIKKAICLLKESNENVK